MSLGSPLSQHSTQTNQTMGGGITKIGKQTIITKEMLQSMPAGSSLKQIATAAAKANLGQTRSSVSGLAITSTQQLGSDNSAKKQPPGASSRASAAGIAQNGAGQPQQNKPNLQIPLQTHNHQHLLPRSGPNAVTGKSGESFTGVNQSTPSSLNGGLNIPG